MSMLVSTFSPRSKLSCCWTTPICARILRPSVFRSCPSTVARPDVGGRRVVSILIVVVFPAPFGPRNPNTSERAMSNETRSTATLSPKCRDNSSTRTTCSRAMTVEPLVNRNRDSKTPSSGIPVPSGRLLLPCFFSLRAQLPATALSTTSRTHRVPGVALHADHLVQPAALGLREAGHHGGEPPAAYEGFAGTIGLLGIRALAIWVAKRRNASSTFWPLFADAKR